LLCILNRMTNVLADSWELLLERMVAIEQRRKSSPEIIALYIHRVLREAARRNFSEREPLIQRFLPVLLKDAPRETYYQIDRLAQGWEAEVAYEWNSYANKHRPPTIVEKAERAWDERQRRKALEDAKKALAGKKVMPIGKAYRPELKKEVTGEERASLILAYNFMLAWEADSDADLIKAFNDFSEYGQSESFELTDHEQKRIRLAQFRTVLKQKNRSALQLANDYGLMLRDYKGATPDEREWFELALRLLSAYEDENDRAIVAAVKAIIASGLGKFFKFTREEHERILSAQGQGQGKSSSKEQKPRGQIPPSVPTDPAQQPPRSGSLPNGQATAPSRPGSIPIPQGVIALVNGRPISKQMFIKVQKIKAPYLHNQIDLLEIQMENKPSLKSVNRPKVKELKEQAKPEKFQQLVLEDLVNDLLIQDGISQATTEGASQQEFEPQTHELTSDFDKLKKYIDATPHYQLFVDKQLEDSDLVEFLRLVWRQRLFAYYLKQKKRKEIEEWLNECKKKITIDYADEYNPKSGKRFPWFGKG